MAKLTEYPQATTFDANDIFIKDGTGGTKKITIEDVVKFIIKYPNANLAPDYSASSTYIKNELVIHDGELYKAKDNIETAEAWNSAHWEKTKISIALSQLDEDVRVELENKANIDGSYIDLTAGASHQLISAVTIEDQAPYNFRTSGGSVDIGDRETDMIVGGTVAWNQKMTNGNFVDTTDVAVNSNFNTMAVANNILTVTVTAVGTSGNQIAFNRTGIPSKAGHKMLFSYFANPSKETRIRIGATSAAAGNYNLSGASVVANEWNHIQQIGSVASGNSGSILYFYYNINSQLSVNDTVQFKNVTAFDLTQMFGTTIADYVYSLEQANAGDGVAWFKKLFPKNYYAYDAGSIQSVQTSVHKMIGFNAFDKNASDVVDNYYLNANGTPQYQVTWKITGYIPVIGGQTYYLAAVTSSYATVQYMVWYDSSKNIIAAELCPGASTSEARRIKTAPENAVYARVSVNDSYWDTFIFNLSWDGERNGEYEPYVEHTYPLDDSLILRGLPKLDVNSKLYYDGDTYASDGVVTRNYGVVDLGTLTWTYSSSSTYQRYFYSSAVSAASRPQNVVSIITPKYTAVPNMGSSTFRASDYNNCICIDTQSGSPRFLVQDTAYTDATVFRTAMSGVYLVYKRASSTTEQATMYKNLQIVDDFGTEEYVDAGVEAGARDVAIPVGHETLYYPNLRAKLEMAPNSPDGNGDYIVRQANGQNTYVPFSDAEALAKKADIDGNYETMTVGNAEQLVSTVGIEDQVPYIFRTSGGAADIGDREIDMIVGGTIVWNQLIKNGNFDNGATNWGGTTGTVAASDNVLTYTCGAAIHSGGRIYQESNIPKLAGHKILLSVYVNPSVATRVSFGDASAAGGIYNVPPVDVSANAWTHVIQVGSVGDNNRADAIFIYLNRTSALAKNDTVQFKNVMVFDLTQMFGATVADYVYSLEQSSTGSGVAWFKKLFQKDYYAYDAGTLQSVQTSAHRMIGFNAWDEEWELGNISSESGNNASSSDRIRSKNYIHILPNTTYYFKAPRALGLRWYDANKSFVGWNSLTSNRLYETPANAHYLRFVVAGATSYEGDICINLSWDGERNGKYESYVEHSYPLDDSLTLRGVPMRDASNKLYYNGDTYASDGTVTRKCAEQTFVGASGESWSIYQFATEMPRYAFSIDPAIPRNKSLPRTELVATGVEISDSNAADVGAAATTISCRFGSNAYTFYISIPRSQFSGQTLQEVVAEFKVWLASNPVSITYERETYVTETADPYTNPQIVDDFGTEEYVDAGVESGAREVAIPVGHQTFYQANLRAKLEMAPDSPSGGESQYVVYHDADGNNTYVPLIIPKEIPDIPSEAGTYNLRLVVDSHGQFDMTWIPET